MGFEVNPMSDIDNIREKAELPKDFRHFHGMGHAFISKLKIIHAGLEIILSDRVQAKEEVCDMIGSYFIFFRML